MHTITQTVPVSKPMLWTGRVMSALPILLVLFGSVVKLMKSPGVAQGFERAGIPVRLMVPVGIIELICAVVLCDSAYGGARSHSDDGCSGRRHVCEPAFWRSDLSDADDSRDDGLGRPVSAGCPVTRVDAAAPAASLETGWVPHSSLASA